MAGERNMGDEITKEILRLIHVNLDNSTILKSQLFQADAVAESYYKACNRTVMTDNISIRPRFNGSVLSRCSRALSPPQPRADALQIHSGRRCTRRCSARSNLAPLI